MHLLLFQWSAFRNPTTLVFQVRAAMAESNRREKESPKNRGQGGQETSAVSESPESKEHKGSGMLQTDPSTSGSAAARSDRQAEQDSGGQVGQRPESTEDDDVDSAGEPSSSYENDEPIVKVYPANSEQIITQSPTSSEWEREERDFPFWEQDEEELLLADLRSRFESDR